MDNEPSATIKFNITNAEKTIAWFYSGVKQDSYESNYAQLSLFNVLPNGVEVHRSCKSMLLKCRVNMDSLTIYTSRGVSSLRIDDKYGWDKKYS